MTVSWEQFSTILAQDCDFSYRHSIFKDDPNRFVITHVTFKLLKQAHFNVELWDLKQAVERNRLLKTCKNKLFRFVKANCQIQKNILMWEVSSKKSDYFRTAF